MIKGVYDGHKFLTVDFVVSFRQRVLGREECHGVEDAVLAILGQYSCRNVVGSIGLNNHIAVKVEVCQDGGRSETLVELLVSELLILILVETLVLPRELRERMDGG